MISTKNIEVRRLHDISAVSISLLNLLEPAFLIQETVDKGVESSHVFAMQMSLKYIYV